MAGFDPQRHIHPAYYRQGETGFGTKCTHQLNTEVSSLSVALDCGVSAQVRAANGVPSAAKALAGKRTEEKDVRPSSAVRKWAPRSQAGRLWANHSACKSRKAGVSEAPCSTSQVARNSQSLSGSSTDGQAGSPFASTNESAAAKELESLGPQPTEEASPSAAMVELRPVGYTSEGGRIEEMAVEEPRQLEEMAVEETEASLPRSRGNTLEKSEAASLRDELLLPSPKKETSEDPVPLSAQELVEIAPPVDMQDLVPGANPSLLFNPPTRGGLFHIPSILPHRMDISPRPEVAAAPKQRGTSQVTTPPVSPRKSRAHDKALKSPTEPEVFSLSPPKSTGGSQSSLVARQPVTSPRRTSRGRSSFGLVSPSRHHNLDDDEGMDDEGMELENAALQERSDSDEDLGALMNECGSEATAIYVQDVEMVPGGMTSQNMHGDMTPALPLGVETPRLPGRDMTPAFQGEASEQRIAKLEQALRAANLRAMEAELKYTQLFNADAHDENGKKHRMFLEAENERLRREVSRLQEAATHSLKKRQRELEDEDLLILQLRAQHTKRQRHVQDDIDSADIP